MIVCIVTKTPLLVIGKPGCSKTLSFHIVKENLKGPGSGKFFRTLPILVDIRYQVRGCVELTTQAIPPISPRLAGETDGIGAALLQGSEKSSSDEIDAVFRKAIRSQQTFDKGWLCTTLA